MMGIDITVDALVPEWADEYRRQYTRLMSVLQRLLDETPTEGGLIHWHEMRTNCPTVAFYRHEGGVLRCEFWNLRVDHIGDRYGAMPPVRLDFTPPRLVEFYGEGLRLTLDSFSIKAVADKSLVEDEADAIGMIEAAHSYLVGVSTVAYEVTYWDGGCPITEVIAAKVKEQAEIVRQMVKSQKL